MNIREHDLWYSGNLLYSWSEIDLRVTEQFTSLDKRTEKCDAREHRCRVFELNPNTSRNPGTIINGTYDECYEAFQKAVQQGKYVELQVYNKYDEMYGTCCLLDNLDAEYFDAHDRYWAKRAEEEDDWRPGDAPWEAPGMSWSDFF